MKDVTDTAGVEGTTEAENGAETAAETAEIGVRNEGEGGRKGGREEERKKGTMRAVPVYRVDYGRKTKEPIGVVFEKRKKERSSNYFDLLRLARRLFALDTADAVHIIVDASEARRAILRERTSDCSPL